MKAEQELDIAERRSRVLGYFAEHPSATYRTAAAALDIPLVTLHRDFKAATADIVGRSRDAYVATMVRRNELLVATFLHLAQRSGSTAAAMAALAADKRTADLIGLDAPKKVEQTVTVNVQEVAAEVAAEFDIPYERAVAEAERIVAEARR